MASIYAGLNRGVQAYNPDNVAANVGTSTASTDVEVRMDETKGLTRKDIKLILEAVIHWLEDGRLDSYFH